MSRPVPNPTATATPTPVLGLLSAQQVALELGVGLRTLSRMFDNKIGPPRIVITRKIYYRRASVEAFLAKSEGFDRVPMIRRRVRRNARRAA